MPVINETLFKEYLRNKKVALVGPSKTIQGTKSGNLIDSYDVVVRVNRSLSHIEGNEEDVGTKTDILYACLSTGLGNNTHPRTGKKEVDIDLYVNSKVKFISEAYPREEGFYDASIRHNVVSLLEDGRVRLRHLPKENYFNIKNKVGCHLNSGMVAMTDLLTSSLRELYITGIDFHRTTYMEGYETFTWEELLNMHKNHSGHDPDKQFKYFKYEIYRKDCRVKVDNSLEHFLSDDKYEITLK